MPKLNDDMTRLAASFGWRKDLLIYPDHALLTGNNPSTSMGSNTSMAALSPQPSMLADYFREVFPQLKRPPFNFISDTMDMSVSVDGLHYNSPLLRPDQKIETHAIGQMDYQSWIDYVQMQSAKGNLPLSKIILSDDQRFENMPIAIRALRLALDEAGWHETKIVVNTGQVQTPHHLAVLVGCGASLVYPYLLYEYGQAHGEALKIYVAFNDGLKHAISRAGIKSANEYVGAFHFETIGIDGRDETLTKLFGKTSLDFGGLTFNDLSTNHLSSSQANRELISQTFINDLRNAEKNYSSTADIAAHQLPAEVKSLYDAEDNRLVKSPVVLRHLFELNSQQTTTPKSLEHYLKAYQIAGMAYGAIKSPAHNLLAQVASELGIQMSTGAGPRVAAGIKTAQLSTGRFGVDADFLLNCSVVELKIAQGASPGDVGQFAAARVNVDMAITRNCLPNTILPNPAEHYDINNLAAIAMEVNELHNLFAGAGKKVEIAVKLVSSNGIGDLAVELAKLGVDTIKVTGDNGGNMSAPSMSIYNSGMPTELGIRDVHIKLTEAGLRSSTKIVQSGDVNLPRDIAFAYLNGADAVESGKGALIHLAGCELHAACFDCTKGITSNPEKFERNLTTAKISLLNLLSAAAEILAGLGYDSPQAATGKLHEVATLRNAESLQNSGVHIAPNLNMAMFLNAPREFSSYQKSTASVPTLETTHGSKLAGETFKYRAVSKFNSLTKTPQSCTGEKGDGYAAYLNGLTLINTGSTGKFAGKSMSSGSINIINPLAQAVDDYALYAATGGKANIAGNAGDFFMVANSGSDVVVEGNLSNNAFREMRRGSAIVLGSIGADSFKSCYGGIFTIYDPKNEFNTAPPGGKVYSLTTLTDNPLLKNALQSSIIKRLHEFCIGTGSNENSLAQAITHEPEAHFGHFKIIITSGMRLNMDSAKAKDLAEVFKAKPPSTIEQAVLNIIEHAIAKRKVSIRPMSEDDMPQVLNLSLSPEQEPYVGGSINVILAGLTAKQHPYVITSGSTVVGFYILDEEYTEKERNEIASNTSDVILRKFFVDQRQQGQGFGADALKCMVRDTLRYHPDATQIVLTVNCKNAGAAQQYVKAGFVQHADTYNGGTKGPQYIMRTELQRQLAKTDRRYEIDRPDQINRA